MLCDPVVMASALSVVPPTGFPPNRTDLNYLEKFMKWVTKHFKVSTTRVTQSNPEVKDILNCISSGKAQSVEELVYTCVAVCRSLGILSRLVLSLQPLPAKVDSSELQQKSPDQNKKTKEKKHSPVQIEKANTSDVRSSLTGGPRNPQNLLLVRKLVNVGQSGIIGKFLFLNQDLSRQLLTRKTVQIKVKLLLYSWKRSSQT
jgi:hypothetical protein